MQDKERPIEENNEPSRVDEQHNTSKENKKKKWYRKPYLITVSAVVLSSLVTYSATNYYLTKRMPWDIGGNESVLSGEDIRTLQQTYHLIQSSYYGTVDHDSILNGALSGMVSAVQDPYTSFFIDEESSHLSQEINGKFGGIGATVMSKNNQIIVESVVKSSPAEEAGIQAQDVIVSVNGESLEGKTAGEAVQLIRGEVGTPVTLEILRDNSSQTLTITRGEISIETVSSEILADHPDIGYIDLSSFSENTPSELKTQITDLREKGAKQFIFDVRSNPGGTLTSALEIANMFLKEGKTIVQVESKDGEKHIYTADNTTYGDFKIEEPVVLLVNSGSASASEILAAALKESAHIPIIGTTTYGKGTVQSVFPYENGAAQLKITTAHWLTPNGEWINEKGITPDEEVTLPEYSELRTIDTTKTYQINEQSDAISNIQNILVALGELDDTAVTGVFDVTTEQAVKKFQSQNNLSSTNGTVDATTAEALMNALRQKIVANDTQKQAAIKKLVNH